MNQTFACGCVMTENTWGERICDEHSPEAPPNPYALPLGDYHSEELRELHMRILRELASRGDFAL